MYHGEKLNSITHLVGSALAFMGLGALLTVSIQLHDPWMITSFSVFGGTLVLLYTMSTLYHSFYPPTLKKLFQKMDHLSIYLLIAGTYTPYMLVSLRDGAGPQLLAVVWGLAVLGILLELHPSRRIEALQLFIYLLMGWLAMLEWNNLKAAISTPGVMWLSAGGIAYTLGITFYVLDHRDKMRHAHGIWHLFVLLGSVCHFISIIAYVR
jgi:hemolysin III